MRSTDPATYQVIVSGFGSIVEEMQSALFRTGFSTTLRESHDGSAGLTTADGRLVGQMTVLPSHMGAFPACVEGVLASFAPEEMAPGDSFVLNDPYLGGSPHSPDVAVVAPVFVDGRLVAFACTMAHKADLGAATPGGASTTRDLFHDGLLLPPVRWGRDIEAVVRRNSRVPEVVIGDLRGQMGANALGVERFTALCRRWGAATVLEVAETLFDRTEARVRAALRTWPDGRHRAEGFMDSDGMGPDAVRLEVLTEKAGDRIRFDFSGSDAQRPGPVNIRPALVRAACYYALVACIDPDLPNNAGLARAVEARFAPRSVLNPDFPAGVILYSKTINMVAELALATLGRLCPDRRIACSGATTGLTLAHEAGGRTAVQYELLGTGGGGRLGLDGVTGIQTHTANCRTAPIEIIESEFPVRVRRFELRRDSGGAGTFRGGLGFDREYEVLGEAALVTTRGDFHRFAAWGVDGGGEGARGRFLVNPGRGDQRVIPARYSGRLLRGEVLLLQTPGGGGFGPPDRRGAEAVAADLADGYVSRADAEGVYGTEGRRKEADPLRGDGGGAPG